MSRTLSFALLFAASCVATDESTVDDPVEREEEEEERGEILPVKLHRDVDKEGRELPGTLVFDTSKGQYDLTALIPLEPRRFDDVKQFHAWAIEALGAQPEEIEGVPVVTLGYRSGMTLRYDRERDDMVPVDDPVAAIVGGTAGYVEIAGKQICVSRTAECSREAGLSMPEKERRGIFPWEDEQASSTIRIRGNSWVLHSMFVEWVGSSTIQTGGGISHTWAHCGPLDPNWCWVRRGSNFLSTLYTARTWDGRVADMRGASDFNVYLVQNAKVLYGFYPFPLADGVCATHFGTKNGFGVFFRTFFPPFFSC